MEAAGQESLMFDDVAIYFTQEEWRSLEEWQKELYKEVMMDNYHNLQSLGIPMVKSELLLLIEGGEEPYFQGHPKWEDLGCEPQTTPETSCNQEKMAWRSGPDGKDGEIERLHLERTSPAITGDRQRQRSGEVTTYNGVWADRRPLTYHRRVVRKRCSRRSPNFSRVELESFVSLMDRYLPDELQRTGAISLRQRRSILQHIARRLEPMSGCLRTPRQLLHRWADFNNRDPERLMEIRMQLHFASSCDQSWGSSEEQTTSSEVITTGRRWRRRNSRPLLSSSSSSFSEEGEETQEDSLSTVWDEGLHESTTHYFPVLPDPPPQNPTTTQIDARGRYIVPPPLPKSEESWWQCSSEEWIEEQKDLQGSLAAMERSPATLYLSLHEQDGHLIDLDPETHAGCTDSVPGLRTIKSEPDSEEDEGGGSWSCDVPSPESVVSSRSHRRKVSEGESNGQQSPALVSPDDSFPWREPPAGGRTDVKLEADYLSEPCSLESQTCTEQEDSPGSRSMKRSPNFSPAELECFVALMDHFLPDNLIRAGAIPIRQRKSILQEIARRLEPLSGCLRTPRQLRHRWTDFNNRDPDRLEVIRSRLRRAALLQESCKKSSKEAVSAPATGNNWRRRRSRTLQRNIKEEEQTPEQTSPDTSEEHIPRIPWRHSGLPKLRNSFSMARLKKNHHLALHILSIERLLRRVDQRQERLLQEADLSADEDDSDGLN